MLGAVAVAALSACGGGGSGGSAPPPAPAPVVNQAPDASFTVSDGDGLAPLPVTFDASAATDPDGSITTFAWDFGDDDSATANGATVSHVYQDTGTFTVRLTVTDDDGASDSTTRTVRVRGATVSGVIGIGAGSAVDSDVNDSFTTPRPNDEFGLAQAVDDPLRLGGFVNVPGTGAEDGNFHSSGDRDDYFFIELEGNERIVLSIAEPDADLDLELYNDDPTPALVDASVSANPGSDLTEDLPVPEAGSYFVRVTAVAGASNYVLSIEEDSPLSTGPRRAKRLSDPFVPGELLMTTAASPTVSRHALTRAAGGGLLLAPAAAEFTRSDGMAVPAAEPAPGATMTAQIRLRYQTLLAARRARQRDDVGIAELNVLRQPLRVPNDPFYDYQWHYREIGLEQAWDLTTGREPATPQVVVAVVDTGVLLDHPDLTNQLLRDAGGRVIGFDFIQDPQRANDGDGIDPNPDDPGNDSGSSFHGTHVAGTVAADTDNDLGVAGVSWGARLMPVRALGIDGGTTFDVLQAMRYAAGLPNTSGTVPPVTADIINLSLGSDFFSDSEQQAIDEIRARGVFLVASAGNDASSVPSYPAAYDGVVSVAATTIRSADETNQPARYSNFGPTIDIAAPGGDFSRPDISGDGQPDAVFSTQGAGSGDSIEFGFSFLQGTSMAAPHVSGVIALMKAVYPGLTPTEFDALLQDGQLTDEAGPAGRDDLFGFGIVNAFKAVQAATLAQGGEQPTLLLVSESRLDFQAFSTAFDFEVTSTGSEPVSATVSADAPWLNVAPRTVGADGLGIYRATVSRSGLANGRYGATITVASNTPDVSERTIDVIMQVTSPDIDADAGQHYVILVPPDEEESRVAQIVSAANGEYSFRLDDVPPGDYRLFAGTDHDNDAFICDGGEACGAYPNLSSPAVISVDAREQPELPAQSFSSEYRTTATTNGAGGASAQSSGGIAVRTGDSR